MGTYLQIFNSVKENIYNNNIKGAATKLKELLNNINFEFISLPAGEEKLKRKNTITKLLPALKDLNKGVVTDVVINALKLDRNKLFKETSSINEEKTISQPKQEIRKPQIKRPKDVFIPLTLDDYIGQEKAKQSLKISITAAKVDNRVLNHLLICSSYGLGKTTLANIIANEMNMPFFNVNATNLKDVKSVAQYFSKINESCIIFIDEIHSLKNDVQTMLLSILTDFQVNFINENGEEEKHDLPPFTLIGATTQAGELLKPFINRFQILELQDYTQNEKEVIVKSKFDKIGYEIDDNGIKEIARRSRGIPRTIEIFAKGIRDIALTKGTKIIDDEIISLYFKMYDIDENGLNKNDLFILNVLNEATRPLALITLESKTGIQKEDIEYRYEPYLIKLGLIEKTEKGRIITDNGRKYLSKNIDEEPSFDEDNIIDSKDNQENIQDDNNIIDDSDIIDGKDIIDDSIFDDDSNNDDDDKD